jgi:uncharacterized membrane protein YvbJ
MRNKKRLEIVESELRDLYRSYKDLLDGRIHFQDELRSTFNRELAQYRSAVQGTQTDRIKFNVLEEWINEVFKLNNLKFNQSDFIERSERDRIETEVREQIAKQIEDFTFEKGQEMSISPAAFPRIQVALAKLVRETR